MDIKLDEKNDGQRHPFVNKILGTSIEVFVGSVLFIGVFFIILLQIFSREMAYILYVLDAPFSLSPPIWTEELARWCWVWIVFIMVGFLEKIDGHLKVTFFADKISKRAYAILTIILDILYFATMILIFKLSIDYLMRNLTTVPITLPVSNLWLNISLPIGLVFVLVRVFFRIYYSIKALLKSKEGV